MAFDTTMHPLDSGTIFPTLRLQTITGDDLTVPLKDAPFTVVLIYRGEW